MKTIKYLLLSTFGVVILVVSCKKDHTSEITPGSPTEVIIPVIDWALQEQFDNAVTSWVGCADPQLAVVNEPVQTAPAYEEQSDNYQCTITPMQIAPGFSMVNLFQPDNIRVGGWYKGTSIHQGTWTEVPVANFNPLTVNINLATEQGVPPVWTINNPKSQSEYLTAHNELRNLVIANSTPAYVSYTVTEVHSANQASSHIGVSAGGWGSSVAASYDYNNKEIQSRFLIKFVQKYYTVGMDIPTLPSNWFSALPDYNQLEAHCPTYVSSIDYGRIVCYTIESKSSSTETKAAIEGSFSGWGFNAGFDYNQANFSNVEISNIKAFVLGGSSDFLNDYSDIGGIISSGAQFSQNSPGVPIAFTMRKVSDNSVINFVTAANYNVQQCSIIGVPATVNLNSNQGHLLCPVRTNGDNEYGGCCHIFGNVRLQIRNTGSVDSAAVGNEIWVVTDAKFYECANPNPNNPNNNYTQAKIDPDGPGTAIHLYTAPPGRNVLTIVPHTTVTFNHIDPEDGDYSPFNLSLTPSTGSGFIQKITCVGDTSGDELPCDGSDDKSYFKIYFKSFDITLTP